MRYPRVPSLSKHAPALLIACALAAPALAAAETAPGEVSPSVMIEAASPAAAEAAAARNGLVVRRAFPWIGWYELGTPEGTTSGAGAQAALEEDPAVTDTDAVVPGEKIGLAFTPRDPFWQGNIATATGNHNGQWHLAKANFPAAFDKATGRNTLIGIVDSEFFTDHPDLSSKIRNPKNFANGTPNYLSGNVKAENDTQNHGTHVTGIAAAATDNGVGGSGAGFDANVVPAKIRTSFLPGGGAAIDAGFVADLVEALGYMQTQGVAVVNLSLGGTRDHPPIAAAIAALRATGVTVVVAAGNNQQSDPNAPIYPASYPGAFAVANTRADNTINPTSSNGTWVDIAAPGTDIISTWDERSVRPESFPVTGGSRYGIISGTSMAAPVVTGLVALMKSARPDLTPDEVESLIQSTATDLGSSGRDPQFGAGLIDANKAVAAAIAYVRPAPPAPPAPAPAPAPAPPAGDTLAPAVKLNQKVSLRGTKAVTVRFTCSELCSGRVRLFAVKGKKKGKRLSTKSYAGQAGKTIVVKLNSNAKLRPSAKIWVEISSADAAGNLTTATIKRSLKR